MMFKNLVVTGIQTQYVTQVLNESQTSNKKETKRSTVLERTSEVGT